MNWRKTMKARDKAMLAALTRQEIAQTAVILLTIALIVILFLFWSKSEIELDISKEKIKRLQNSFNTAFNDNQFLVKEKAEIEAERDKLAAENSELKAALLTALVETFDKSVDKSVCKPIDQNSEPVEEVNPLLPPQDIPTNTYRCEPYMVKDEEKSTDTETVYKSAFARNSEQAALQEDCFTDIETGIRYYFDSSDGSKWYCAALAGAYGIEIGHCYIFTLANGTELPVMLADFKHDITKPKPDDYGDDDTNYDGESCINVIEFVVDMPVVPESVKKAGTMSALDKFGGLYGHGGNIVDAKDAGRRWKA